MKKVILGILSLFVVFTCIGCGKENFSLDLNKISKQLDTLTSEKIDIHSMNIENIDVFENLEDVFDNDFLKKFNLNKDLIEEYVVKYNEEKKEILAIFKPFSGKSSEVKNQLNTFMTSINAKLEEVDGLLIYVASKNNDLVIKTIKESKEPVFGAMMEVSKDDIKQLLNIESSDVEEFLMKTPMMNVQASTYIIVKPTKGKENVVKDSLEDYMKKLENQWSTYLPAQYEIVKNRKVEKIGDYLVYIATSDNDLVFNTISNNKVKK